jgi:hypothetical protein
MSAEALQLRTQLNEQAAELISLRQQGQDQRATIHDLERMLLRARGAADRLEARIAELSPAEHPDNPDRVRQGPHPDTTSAQPEPAHPARVAGNTRLGRRTLYRTPGHGLMLRVAVLVPMVMFFPLELGCLLGSQHRLVWSCVVVGAWSVIAILLFQAQRVFPGGGSGSPSAASA